LNSTDLVDVVVGAEQTSGILTQDAQHLKFWGTVPKNTADFWPLKAEGNLAMSGGKSQSEPDLHWSAKISRAKVEVTAVPLAYYADSNSWMPFRFKITDGKGSQFYVTSGEVQFYIGNEWKSQASIFANKNHYIKPKTGSSNGDSDEYLALAPAGMFDGAYPPSAQKGAEVANAHLRIVNFYCKNVSTEEEYGPLESELSTAFLFGDDTIEIFEIFGEEFVPYDKTKTRQLQVGKEAQNEFLHVAGNINMTSPEDRDPHDDDEFPVKLTEQAVGTPSQHPNTAMSDLGFDYWCASYTNKSQGGNLAYEQKCALHDWNEQYFNHFGQIVEARSLDKQTGVIWKVYYNSVPGSNNPFGEQAVGVYKSQTGIVRFFENGTYSTTADIVAYNGNAFYAGVFNLASALTGVSAGVAAFVAPPVAAILGAASSLERAIAIALTMAEINLEQPVHVSLCLFKVYGIADGVEHPSKDECVPIEKGLGEGSGLVSVIGDITAWQAGFTSYRAYLSTSVTIRSRSYWSGVFGTGDDVDVDAALNVEVPADLKGLEYTWTEPYPNDPDLVKIQLDFDNE
jgi:hypothetical protein